MRNLNIGGSWMDEFVKIASEKGWVVTDNIKTAEEPPLERDMFTNEQWSMLKGYIANHPGVQPRDALVELQREYPDVFADYSGVTMEKEEPFVPKMPEWMKEETPAAPVAPATSPDKESRIQAVMGRNPHMTREDAIFYLENRADDVSVTASVIGELISLASDLEEMGEVEAAIAVDKQVGIYKEALDKLYDVTGETGEQLINEAHPGGGPVMAPAKDEGGKVETLLEEHKKMVDKATKKPTGKYAELVMNLIATANSLEDEGRSEEAKLVDDTIRDLLQTDPFVNRSLASEMASSEDNVISDLQKEAQTPEAQSVHDRMFRILNSMVQALDELEGSVQNQNIQDVMSNLNITNPKDLELPSPYAVSTSGTNYKYAYDNYVMSLKKIVIAWKSKIYSEWKDDPVAYIPEMIKLSHEWSKNLRKIRDYYNAFSYFKTDGSWPENWKQWFNPLWKELVTIYIKGKKVTPATQTKPAPAKELPIEEQAQQTLRTEYLDALGELEQYLRANVKKVMTALGRDKFNSLAKWIRNQKLIVGIKKTQVVEVKDIDDLRKWIIQLKAINPKTSALNVKADGAPPIALPTKPAPAPAAKKKTVKVDEKVRAFQQAAIALYGPDAVGPRKDDGQWGPATKAAYDKVMRDVKEQYPEARTYPALPTEQSLSWGTQVANYLTKTKKTSLTGLKDTFQFTIAPGVYTRVSDLKDAKSFMNALARERYSGIIPPVKDQVEASEQAMKMLANFYKKLMSEEYQNQLWLQTGSRDVATKLMALVNDLFGQIHKLPSGAQALKNLQSKKKPAGEKPAAPGVKEQAPGFFGRGSGKDLKSGAGIYKAIRNLVAETTLAMPNEFMALAIRASGVNKNLKKEYNIYGKLVPISPGIGPREYSDKQKQSVTEQYLNELEWRVGDIRAALRDQKGEIETRYSNGAALWQDWLETLQAYMISLDELKGKMKDLGWIK